MCPALGAQPSLGAGLHATLWKPVTLTGAAKFKAHVFPLARMAAAATVP